jgi:hypothetical protein
VKEQRLLVHDEELVEAEASTGDLHGRADPEDAIRDFVNVGARLGVREDHGLPLGLKRMDR